MLILCISPTKSPNMGGYKGYVLGFGTIEALEYGSDTCSEIGLSITQECYNPAGVNSITAGYVCGGNLSSAASVNYINKLSFAVETKAGVSATLPTARASTTGISSYNTGYIGNGGSYQGSWVPTSTLESLNFSTEATSNQASTLTSGSLTSSGMRAGFYGGSKGFFHGGNTTTWSALVGTNGFNYTTKTAYTTTRSVYKSRGFLSGLSSQYNGFAAGGQDASNYYNVVDGMNLDLEYAVSPSATIGTGRDCQCGFSSREKGFWCGGTNGSALKTISAINFSDLTSYSSKASLVTANNTKTGVQCIKYPYNAPDSLNSSTGNGYLAGGYTTSSVVTTTINKMQFSSDTNTCLNNVIPSGAEALGYGLSASTRGYVTGGVNGSNTRTDKIYSLIFATDVASYINATLSVPLFAHSGVYNTLAGYSMGGYLQNGTIVGTINKLLYSSETNSVPSATITARINTGGVSSSTSGYVLGGNNGGTLYNIVEKLLFSTETKTTLTKTQLIPKLCFSGTQSLFNGYSIGGSTSTSNTGYTKYTDGVNFSSDVVSLVNAALSTPSTQGSGMSSFLNGYSGGFWTGVNQQYMSKMSFDTEASLPFSSLIYSSVLGLSGMSNPQGTNTLTITDTGTGYSMGGYTSGAVNYVTAIKFTTGSVYIPAQLLAARCYQSTGLSFSSAGYNAGGLNSGNSVLTSINKYAFSNETPSVISATLTTAVWQYPAFNTSQYGYIIGGLTANNATSTYYRATIQKFTVSTETCQQLTATTNSKQRTSSDVGYATSSYGYIAGQDVPDFFVKSSIERVTLSTETAHIIKTVLSSVRQGSSLASSIKGYTCGGNVSGNVSFYNTVDFMSFLTESNCILSSTLSSTRSSQASAYNYSKGYLLGGYNGGNFNTIDSLDFSTDSITTNSNYVTLGSYRAGGGLSNRAGSTDPFSDNSWFKGRGYYFGGYNGSTALNLIEGLDYATESFLKVSYVVHLPRYGIGTTYSSTNAYLAGGWNTSLKSDTERFAFATESNTPTSWTLATPKQLSNNTQSSTNGYYINGVSNLSVQTLGSIVSNTVTDKLNFSNETSTTSNSSIVRRSMGAGIESSTKGYICGGQEGTTSYNTIDGIVFSTDTLVSPTAHLSAVKSINSGVSSSSNGYVVGGMNTWASGYVLQSSIEIFSFNNEALSSASFSLSAGRSSMGECSSSTAGYLIGGTVSAGRTTNIESIDFTAGYKDTVASLSDSRNVLSGASNISTMLSNSIITGYNGKGMFANGQNGSTYTSYLQILKFADESLSVGSVLSTFAFSGSASSSTKGYIAGGYDDNVNYSLMSNIAFADQVNRTMTATLSSARYIMGSCWNSSYGYFSGGNASHSVMSITRNSDKLSFSTETRTTLTNAMVNDRVTFGAEINSATSGYLCGGRVSQTFYGQVVKFVFSNETSSLLGITLTGNVISSAGTYNATDGYSSAGIQTGGAAVSTIDKISLSDETLSTFANSMSSSRQASGAASSATRGFIFGGFSVSTTAINAISYIQFSVSAVADSSASLFYSVGGMASIWTSN